MFTRGGSSLYVPLRCEELALNTPPFLLNFIPFHGVQALSSGAAFPFPSSDSSNLTCTNSVESDNTTLSSCSLGQPMTSRHATQQLSSSLSQPSKAPADKLVHESEQV